MANKKYTDYSAGTYDTSKIFLQADATTGALEKINLPTIPPAKLQIVSDVNTANNSGSNPETMATLVLPANTLATDGDVVEMYILMEYLTGSGTKVFNVTLASQLLIQRSNASAAVHAVYINLIRIDSTHYVFRAYILQGTSIFTTNGPTSVVFDPTINNSLTVNVTTGIANDIKYWFSYMKFYLQ